MIKLNAINMEAPNPLIEDIHAFTGVTNGELRFYLVSSDGFQIIEISDNLIHAYDVEDFEYVSEFCQHYKIQPQQYMYNKTDFVISINVKEI